MSDNEEKAIVHKINKHGGGFYGYMIECPGCGLHHVFDERWKFNGNIEKPTFTPSMLAKWGSTKKHICHSFVTDGKIRFLGDCTHDLAGQTVNLKPF